MGLNSSATFTDKVIATGLLGLASYGLVSTKDIGRKYVLEAPEIASKIVRGMFYVMFTIIGAYSVITLVGHLHEG